MSKISNRPWAHDVFEYFAYGPVNTGESVRDERTKLGLINDHHGYEVDFADQLDSPEDRLRETLPTLDDNSIKRVIAWYRGEVKAQPDANTWFEALRVIISHMVSSRHPRLTALGIAFASGLSTLNGLPMAEYAKTVGLTRAAVSKESKVWSQRLDLPPSNYQRNSPTKQVMIGRNKGTGRSTL